MKLTDILPAISKVAATGTNLDQRAITYLATYPSMRALGAAPGLISPVRFHQIAVMVYGWMPRIVRIHLSYASLALAALNAAKAATFATWHTVPADAVARCLRSVVGASKALHFVNDQVFPIWDSKVETFRLRVKGMIGAGSPLPFNHMSNVKNYFDYVKDVHSIRSDPSFTTTFLAPFTAAANMRLSALGIAPYSVSDVRAIEAAAFELA